MGASNRDVFGGLSVRPVNHGGELMTAFIAWLITNPTILAIIGGVVTALGIGWQQRRAGAKAERNKQRAKEADAYEKHLQDLAAAADAGNRVDPLSMPDDPYNRDRKPKG